MDCRVSDYEAVHHKINAQTVKETANHCMIDQERNDSARKVEDAGDDQGDQEMKEESQRRSFHSTLESFGAERAARD